MRELPIPKPIQHIGVHIGLAANTLVDTTTVVWPDNSSTTYTGLAADHIYQLKQDGTYTQIH